MHSDPLARQIRGVFVTALLTLCAIVLAPSPSAAQTFISPFAGFDFGGDSGCPAAIACDDKNSNFGVAVGKLVGIGGGEVEVGYARNFFGDIQGADNSVMTLMFNLIIGPRIGMVRPFVLGGLGIIKSRVEFNEGRPLDSGNEFGCNLGGGLMLMFGDRLGVRGDLRWFKSVSEDQILALPSTSARLGFNRASGGLVIGF